MAQRGDILLERGELLAAADRLLGSARAGRGGLVVFEGEAGIGKSSLLIAAADRAADMQVSFVRPTELERSFSFGAVRRLLERLIGHISSSDRRRLARSPAAAAGNVLDGLGGSAPGDALDVSQAVLHGLFWLLADLAAVRPVVLIVDDAQWADDASMAWLTYAAARLRDVPVAALVASRPVGAADQGHLGRLVASHDDVQVLGVPALTASGVHALVERELGSELALAHGRQVVSATGGNPFLVRELLRAWRHYGVESGLVATPQLRRAVAQRLAGIGRQGTDLARAVAVLGGADVALRHATTLAALTPAQALAAADALSGSGVLEPGADLTFVHPLVREAVYDAMPPLGRAAWHAAAARLLAAAGESAEVAAAHLMSAPNGSSNGCARPPRRPWCAAHPQRRSSC
jgi:predicted ATPase